MIADIKTSPLRRFKIKTKLSKGIYLVTELSRLPGQEQYQRPIRYYDKKNPEDRLSISNAKYVTTIEDGDMGYILMWYMTALAARKGHKKLVDALLKEDSKDWFRLKPEPEIFGEPGMTYADG